MNSKKNNFKSKWNNFIKPFKLLPKAIKCVILVLIIITLTSIGLMLGTVYKSQIKTTNFGLEDVGELVTQTAHLTIVKDNKVNREFFKLFDIPFTESRQIFSYDIEVDAAVDFAKISYKTYDEKEEIVVKLPHARIYKTTLDNESLTVFLDEESLFSRIDLSKHNAAQIEMKKQGEEDAKENGILEAADKNAQKLIEGIIKSAKKYKDYKITYKYIGDK